MRLTRFKLTVLAICLGAIAAPTMAWNARGHMAVAAVAWDHMSPKARARASELLRLNPSYSKWVAGVNDADRDKIAFMKAATWPDEIRDAPGYIDDGYVIREPQASQNIGYQDKFVHRYWHFKDLPFSPDNVPTQQPETPNAISRIKDFSAILGTSNASEDIQSYDLAWVLHLVGDMHQPLHATARFTRATPRGDNGGNLVGVCLERARLCDKDHSQKLHGFWDGAVGSSSEPRSVIAFANRLPKAARPDLERTNPDDWAAESFRLAQRVAYAEPVGIGKGPYRLDREYRQVAGSVAERRIALAGERLAVLLNSRLAN